MHLLSDISLAISQLNMLAGILIHPWKILPGLAAVCLMLTATGYGRYFNRQLLAAIAAFMLVGWRVLDQNAHPYLVPAAVLLTSAAVFSAGSIVGLVRRPPQTDNPYTTPALAAFMSTVLASSLATASGMVHLTLYGSYGKVLSGWHGWAEISLTALRETLWSLASAGAAFAVLAYIAVQMHRRQADGNGGYRQYGIC